MKTRVRRQTVYSDYGLFLAIGLIRLFNKTVAGSLPILLSFLMFSCKSSENLRKPVDLTDYVQPVYEGKESTGLSIYDTNPESPDGRYISFIKYSGIVQGWHNSGVAKAWVMIKDRRTGETRKISEIRVDNHNGANAFWVDNTKLAFMGHYLHFFEVYDVETKSLLFGPVKGELGHKSFQNKIFYSASNSRLRLPNKFRAKFDEEDEGIYRLNVDDGSTERVVSKKEIHRAFMEQNPEVSGRKITLLHVEPSPDNKSILFDFRQEGSGHRQGFVKASGRDVRWIPARPMHVVWYDNEYMMGVDTSDPEKKIYRYNLQGEKLEMLAGTATHFGASPDRNWYVGESGYYEPEEDGYTRVYLYKRGDKEPFALLSEWKNSKITWDWVAHVNPSFSSDGERIYFIRASDEEDRFEAVYFDLSDHEIFRR